VVLNTIHAGEATLEGIGQLGSQRVAYFEATSGLVLVGDGVTLTSALHHGAALALSAVA